MFHSVRARLAVWYAAVFAVFLATFGTAGYVFLSRTTRERVDEGLAETSAAIAGAMEYERKQGATERQAIDNVVREYRLRETQVAVLERHSGAIREPQDLVDSGTTASRVSAPRLVPNMGTILRAAPNTPQIRSIPDARYPIRVYTLPYTLGRLQLVIGAAQTLRYQQRILREAEFAFAVGIPVMLIFATLGGYLLARQGLRQVVVMSARAEAIGAANLHERIPILNPHDELGRLASVLNGLLSRIEGSFEQQRQFMADASHELRTPVAIISSESELALSREDRSPRDLREALATVKEESARLREIVDDLFLLAQANAGERPLRAEPMYLRDVMEECVRGARALASRKGIAVESTLAPDDMPLVGDEALLKRAVMNLVDNAIKYSRSGGHVTISAHRDDGQALIDVEDDGPGVAPDDRERIFDRFFRAPGDLRTQRPPGAGLGLAISRWVARAHGGDVVLAHSDERGSAFRIRIPVPESN